MKKTKLIVVMAMMMSAAVFTACNSAFESIDIETQDISNNYKLNLDATSVVINLPESKAISRIAYSKNDVTSYDVFLLKGYKEVQRKTGVLPGKQIRFEVKEKGSYSVMLNAYNDKTLIGDAQASFIVDFTKMEIFIHLTINPKEKNVGLNIEVDWPEDEEKIDIDTENFVFVKGCKILGSTKYAYPPRKTGENFKGVFQQDRPIMIKDFYICNHEVTQKEFAEIMNAKPSYYNSEPLNNEICENRPVECVSWYDAIAYCNKRSIAEGLIPCYSVKDVDFFTLMHKDIPISNNTDWNDVSYNPNANGYRLPTEAEWEYAAMGGKEGSALDDPTDYAGTNNLEELGDYAWYIVNSNGKTHEVKKKLPNALGLYDMSGNVHEWCWDWYGAISSETPAMGPAKGTNRVVRGGGEGSPDFNCPVAFRYYKTPETHAVYVGFRVVRSIN